MRLKLIDELSHAISHARNEQALHRALVAATHRMGFVHFALAYDEWFGSGPRSNLLIHNYPEDWAKTYLERGLYRNDPVRRACEWALQGFTWDTLGSYVRLTRGDRNILSACASHGISDGFTIPRHLPGQANGTCTFAVGPERQLPLDMLVVAEAVGAAALAAARRLTSVNRPTRRKPLSGRQRECVLWSARGMTAQETAGILGIGDGTVNHHLRLARRRYDVHRSEPLVLSVMYDGQIGFSEVLPWVSGG